MHALKVLWYLVPRCSDDNDDSDSFLFWLADLSYQHSPPGFRCRVKALPGDRDEDSSAVGHHVQPDTACVPVPR
eukprot:CAMPEP_0178628594 /NCGR_PEP_ID=MMETSP0698-20121128/9504_1 /TAXON_ID=265572 /ORGANISM="Extubocellulus spinifer, Strain CCMP396" /LENGTH=73 /DNA_ID=CAMNT_0020267853 /DNA_START=709 /DNA_END=930 /DNA_ORIENTATION=-